MLNKDICKRCIDKNRWPLPWPTVKWCESDEMRWRNGAVYCPLKEVPTFIVRLEEYSSNKEGVANWNIAEGIPEWCPYAAEHAVSSEK